MLSFQEFLTEGSIATSNHLAKTYGFVKKDAYKSEHGHTVRGTISSREHRQGLMDSLRKSGYTETPHHQYGEHGDEVGATFHHPTDGSSIQVTHNNPRRGIGEAGKIVIFAGNKK